jgi:hypothetical protein
MGITILRDTEDPELLFIEYKGEHLKITNVIGANGQELPLSLIHRGLVIVAGPTKKGKWRTFDLCPPTIH